jgi:hypothetical protein
MDPEQTLPILTGEGDGPHKEAEELFLVPYILLLCLWLQPSQGSSPHLLTRHSAAKDLPDGCVGPVQHCLGPVEDPVHPLADQGENVVMSVPHLQLFHSGRWGSTAALQHLQHGQDLWGI